MGEWGEEFGSRNMRIAQATPTEFGKGEGGRGRVGDKAIEMFALGVVRIHINVT